MSRPSTTKVNTATGNAEAFDAMPIQQFMALFAP